MSVAQSAARFWQRYDIRQIEDLCNAVLGAELEAIQLPGPRVRGSLVFAAERGIVYSSGLIDGRVSLRGPLSRDALTIVIILRLGPGSLHWLHEAREGDVGVFPAGVEHDAIYASGSLYVAATLTSERLEEEAAREGVDLAASTLAQSGFRGAPIPHPDLIWLRSSFTHLHDPRPNHSEHLAELAQTVLRTIILHYGRSPRVGGGRVRPGGRVHAVHRALEYIREHLAEPITMEALVSVSATPRRTLYRAFTEVLDDTPQNFVRRLRLHRIRHDLVRGLGKPRTVSAIARSWGAGTDLGRFAARYQQLFGEAPSVTMAMYREQSWQNRPL